MYRRTAGMSSRETGQPAASRLWPAVRLLPSLCMSALCFSVRPEGLEPQAGPSTHPAEPAESAESPTNLPSPTELTGIVSGIVKGKGPRERARETIAMREEKVGVPADGVQSRPPLTV